MVTKQVVEVIGLEACSVLAKILMVTKLKQTLHYVSYSSVLAKILMVTKPTQP